MILAALACIDDIYRALISRSIALPYVPVNMTAKISTRYPAVPEVFGRIRFDG